MTVTTPDILSSMTNTTTALATQSTGPDIEHFADQLAGVASTSGASAATSANGLAAGSSATDALRDKAEQLVSIAFVMPLMKMARNDPFKSKLFHGGQGEEAFGAQLDQRRAEQVAQSVSKPIADAIIRRYKPLLQASPTAASGKGRRLDRHG